MYVADNVVHIINGFFYAYRVRNNSASHFGFSSRVFEDVWNVELCKKFFADMRDKEMERKCETFRDVLNAKYIVLAHEANCKKEIPKEYKRSLFNSLILIKKWSNEDVFYWYVGKVCPGWVKLHSYYEKIKWSLKKK